MLLGGPNGSGKSTLAERVVRDEWGIVRFINADTIARGLAAFDVDVAAASAGRALLGEADRLVEARQDFAAETTLSGRGWANRLTGQFRDAGYRTHLAFVYLPDAEQNVNRVAQRVASGGHDIPLEAIRRRHGRALSNLFRLYMPAVESWTIYNNAATSGHVKIAEQSFQGDLRVFDPVEWDRLRSTHG